MPRLLVPMSVYITSFLIAQGFIDRKQALKIPLTYISHKNQWWYIEYPNGVLSYIIDKSFTSLMAKGLVTYSSICSKTWSDHSVKQKSIYQITSLTVVYSTVYSGADQRKHQRSTSLAFVRGIHRWPVNSPHKWPNTRKMFPFDDVIMLTRISEAKSWSVNAWNHLVEWIHISFG